MNSGILSCLSNGPILSSYDFLLPPLLGRPAEALLEPADKKKKPLANIHMVLGTE